MISHQTPKSLVIFNCDLCTEIAKFLTCPEQHVLTCVNKSLRESSKTFKYVQLFDFHTHTRNKHAIRFANDYEFREQILRSVHYPNKQIEIHLYVSDIVDVSAFGNVHTLLLYDCENIIDVSALGGVQNLTMYNCLQIADLSALGSVPNLKYIPGLLAMIISRAPGMSENKIRKLFESRCKLHRKMDWLQIMSQASVP
jgi:hypothetical protein